MSLRGPVLESAAEAEAAAAAAAAAAEAAEDEDSVKGGADAKAGGDSCSGLGHDLRRASTLAVGAKKRDEKEGGGLGESATGSASAGVLEDKGVTTDKPCGWGGCVFDKVPVLSLREVQGAAGR